MGYVLYDYLPSGNGYKCRLTMKALGIPYELVQNVDVHRSTVTGEPRSMIVKSCFGRYDIVTFHRSPDALDTEATIAAAASLKARVAAFRTTAGK